MNQPHTTAGTWFVTQYEAHGEQLDFGDYLVEHNTSENPWETVDNYDSDYLDIGFKQQAERFVDGPFQYMAGDGTTVFGYVREVRTRVKTRCGCNGNGRHIDPDSGKSRLCYTCDGRNWHWTEAWHGPEIS